MAEINPGKLTQELLDAGIITGGCNSNGVVWDDKNNEIQDRKDVHAVVVLHDPAPDAADILQDEYLKAGVTSRKMIFALWKKVMESDSTDADALQSLMDGIEALIN
jgi:hypothetical protein